MADLQAAVKRVARFREVMARRGYDAVVYVITQTFVG